MPKFQTSRDFRLEEIKYVYRALTEDLAAVDIVLETRVFAGSKFHITARARIPVAGGRWQTFSDSKIVDERVISLSTAQYQLMVSLYQAINRSLGSHLPIIGT